MTSPRVVMMNGVPNTNLPVLAVAGQGHGGDREGVAVGPQGVAPGPVVEQHRARLDLTQDEPYLGKLGDVNQGFAGLQEKYGELRVADAGIRETTIVGQGIGLAMRGFRPIVVDEENRVTGALNIHDLLRAGVV